MLMSLALAHKLLRRVEQDEKNHLVKIVEFELEAVAFFALVT